MKLALFGATGKTGRLIVERALADGHHVTALARHQVPLRHQRLTVVTGAADQPAAIAHVVLGADAVISAMGAGQHTLATFGPHLLTAMRSAGVTRVVSLIGASVPMPGDPRTLSHRLLRAITQLFAADVLADGEAHARVLEASEVQFTLVRPPRLTDGAPTGHVVAAEHLPLGPTSFIARADLAEFMLRVAVEGQYLRAAPMVAHAR
jgi:putative NADH-flavin reductase